MAKTYIGAGGATSATVANQTDYWRLGSLLDHTTTETNHQTLFRTAGTLSNLYVRVTANSIPTTASTVRTRKNVANGGQSVSIGVSATGEFTDGSGTDTIAAGDKLNYQFVPGAATGTMTVSIMSCVFDATTDTVTRHIVKPSGTVSTASTTFFYPLLGYAPSPALTVETNTKCRMRKAGTIKNVCLHLTANRATTSTLKTRKNGADAGVALSLTGGTTGFFEDTGTTDTVTAGEDWNYSLTTGTGVDSMTHRAFFCDFISTAGDGQVGTGTLALVAYPDATTNFAMVSGQLVANATESQTTANCRIAGDYKELTCLVTQNGVSSASSVVLRKNGADTALSASITASTTGVFSDSTDAVTLVATDEINYSIVIPSVAGSQTVTITNIVMIINSLTLTRISLAQIYKYNIIARTSLSRVYKYHVQKRVSLSRIYKYHIINRVGSACIKFDGANDLIECTNDATLWSQSLSKFSFSFWIYPTAGWDGGTRSVVNHGAGLAQRFRCFIRAATTGGITFLVSNAATTTFEATITTLTLNAWHHIVCVYDNSLGSANLKIYHDTNVGPTTGDLTEAINNSATLTLADSGTDFQGYMKDFRWWTTKALNTTEITDVFNNSPSAPTPNYWLKMNEATGNAVDSISGTKTGTLTNGPTWQSNGPPVLQGLARYYKYNVLSRTSLSRIYKYHITARVSLSRIYKYHVLGRITLSRIYKYHIVSRVSLTRIYKYHVLARRSLSRIYKYHILSRVSLSRIYKYHIAVRVSLSRVYKYHVLARRSLSRVYKYNIIGRISLQRIYKYNIIGRISLSRIYRYNIVGRISLSRVYKYNILVRTSLSRIYKYHVAKRVSLSRIYKYHVAVRVSLSRIYKYHILGRISLARIYKYHLQARVSLARVYKYHILGRVSLLRIYKYHVAKRVSLSRIYKYHVAVRVSLSRIYKYHVATRVSLARVYKYNIIGRISLARIYLWNVAVAGLTRISLSRTYKYHVLGRISLARVYKWHLVTRISLARIYKYHLQARVSLQRIYKYNVLQRISLPRIYKYNVLARRSLARVYKYHLLGRVSLARIYKYNIIARVSLARIYLWNVVVIGLTRISKPQIYKYNVATRVSLARIYKYHIANRISLARNYKYNIIGRVTVTRIYKYNLLGRVSLQRIYRYNVIQRISKSQIYKWILLQRVSLARVYKWNVLQRVSLSRIYKWNLITLARISKQQVLKYNVLARLSKSSVLRWQIFRLQTFYVPVLGQLFITPVVKLLRDEIHQEYSEDDPEKQP